MSNVSYRTKQKTPGKYLEMGENVNKVAEELLRRSLKLQKIAEINDAIWKQLIDAERHIAANASKKFKNTKTEEAEKCKDLAVKLKTVSNKFITAVKGDHYIEKDKQKQFSTIVKLAMKKSKINVKEFDEKFEKDFEDLGVNLKTRNRPGGKAWFLKTAPTTNTKIESWSPTSVSRE